LIALLIGVLVASVGFSGGLYYLLRSGRLIIKDLPQKTASAAPVKTHLVALDPLLVNLADAGAYLRLSMTLQVEDDAGKKGAEAKSAKGDDATVGIRDTALAVLGRETSADLLSPGGKERLKAELQRALAEHNADLKVKQIFFTDFLVQQ
jgi:flagellar FliL protein